MHPADDLYRLLLEREQAFQDKTQEVFCNVSFLTDAIVSHLNVAASDIKWISIDKIGVEIVIMVSVPNREKGQYVAPSYTPVQVLTIVIPESVVDTAETDTISQFLDETFDIRKNDGDDNPNLHGIIAAEQTVRRILH